jgi:hypothetical protein
MKFRPRFSVRTLAIFVTLNCAYFACWMPTQKHAALLPKMELMPAPELGGVSIAIHDASAPLPLILCQEEVEIHWGHTGFHLPKRHYLWLHWMQIKLPIESEWHANGDLRMTVASE